MATTATSQITHHEIRDATNRNTIQNTNAWTSAVVKSPCVEDGSERSRPGVNNTKMRAVVNKSYICYFHKRRCISKNA